MIFCCKGNLHEETDMDVGNETSTIRCKAQDSSTSFLTEKYELRTEPIEIDQRRRRSSQKLGRDQDKVYITIRCSISYNQNIFYKQQKCNYSMLILL